MTYKETLLFVGKCLTITHEKRNKWLVEELLKSNTIDWEAVVKLSTAHYVFPALFCNLKRAQFLKYLPLDLVEYMQHITKLNSERNRQIIIQAKEINALLLKNNITPIFLKGTGNLLEDLYEDLGERMIGDIDFIISKDEYPQAIEILLNVGYSKVHKTSKDYPEFKHYPKIYKKGNIAAVEIHKELLIEKYVNEFNYKTVYKNQQFINGIALLSYEDQFCLSIIAKQINDNGKYYNNIALRNAYDIFLISLKINTLNTLDKFDRLKIPLLNFIAICATVFNTPKSLNYKKTKQTKKTVKKFLFYSENIISAIKKKQKTTRLLFIKKIVTIIKQFFTEKKFRIWLFKRIRDKNWRKEKLVQFGIIKLK